MQVVRNHDGAVLPNFFLLGAARSGTTTLARALGQHPQVFVSRIKEPKYLARAELRRPFEGPSDQQTPPVDSHQGYLDLFREVEDEAAIGEASVVYLYCRSAIDEVARLSPAARMIVILRDPIARAFSNYNSLRRPERRLEPCESFLEAVDAEPERLAAWHPRWHYLARSFYHAQLSPWVERFGRERFLFLLYDDLVADPDALVRSCFDFLEVDATRGVDAAARHNASRAETDVPAAVRERLRGLYCEDMARLSVLTGRDLSHWGA